MADEKDQPNETRTSDEELLSFVRKDAAEAREKMSDGADNVVSDSDLEAEEAAFFEEYKDYFNDGDCIELEDDDGNVIYKIKVESMTVRHIRQFKKQLNIAIKRFTNEELSFDEKTGALNWHTALPVIIDIVLDDLFELLAMSCQVIGEDDKLTPLTIDQLDRLQHECLPMIIVPWIRRNFIDPKKQKPWKMAVRGFAMKFLGVSGSNVASAFRTAFQNSQQADTQSTKSSTEDDQAVD